MFLRIVTTILLLLCTAIAYSQTHLKGRVTDKEKKPLKGVFIQVESAPESAFSDSLGRFDFYTTKDSGIQFLIQLDDYAVDTILVLKDSFISIVMLKLQNLGRFGITAEKRKHNIYGHEIIDQGELKKAACCDLAGCFETQGTVQPMTTNIITNSKELRILGLSGVYNQILIDGFPLIQGLGYTYGISSIPGTLVDNIYVAKGTTSVLQGFESMVGQINVLTKNPDKGENLFFNVYANSFGESQYNLNYRVGRKKWSNLLSGHMVQPAGKWDRDKDNFLDLPLLQRYLVFDKMKFGNENRKGFNATVAMRYVWETRTGGQKNFNAVSDLGSDSIYGQKIKYQQAELYSKINYRISSAKKIALFLSGFIQDQNSWLGTVHYKAKQETVYGNLQYESNWKTNHEFKTGVSLRSFQLNEELGFSDTSLKRTYNGTYVKNELIPGVFAENTFKWKGDIITLITGVRADHHNQFGWQITPRTMLKYDLSENSTLRASIGTGWRTVNLFSENIGLLVSSRNIVFAESLNPEKALNWGINFLQKFKKKKIDGFMTMDFYQTRFQNQFFPDYDSDPTKAILANFTGPSVSNGFQTDVSLKFHKQIELKMAYNYLDVYRVVNGKKILLPFNSKHKVLAAVSFVPKHKKYRLDLNAHWFGIQRLPHTEMNPEEFRQPAYSKPYTTFNLQATKSWKKLELYAGCENLFDYRQIRPIVSWQNPFSPYFDTSFNWGPTRGREIYAGLRYKM